MTLEILDKLTSLFLFHRYAGISETLRTKFKKLIKQKSKAMYSFLLFEYTSLELSENDAQDILLKTTENKKAIKQKLGRDIDFRVALLDYMIKHLKTIKRSAKLRFIEEETFLNLNRLIEKDELTKLYNYRYYQSELKKEFSRSKRSGDPFSLLLFDIDDFKLYNDKYGHNEGNVVLKKLGSTLIKNIRKTDIACRYGGEEFIIILSNTDKKAAFILAQKLQKKISLLKFKRKITVSGGISCFPFDTKNTNRTLFEYADKALYFSKEQGKCRTTLYFNEKRKHLRVEPKDIGLVGEARASNSKIIIENISAVGMRVSQNKLIKDFNNEQLKIKLHFTDGEIITIDGRIAYMYKNDTKKKTVGVTFVHFMKKIDKKIQKLANPEKKIKRKNTIK